VLKSSPADRLKEGKKRADIADLLGIGVRQLDKLREKLMRRINNQQ
jgi:DNA-binding CsgD family transcriptional regulator